MKKLRTLIFGQAHFNPLGLNNAQKAVMCVQRPFFCAENTRTQSYATWLGGVREASYEGCYPSLIKHSIYGLLIMPEFAYSKKAHFLLIDVDWIDEHYYKVYGSFTSSKSPYNGLMPEWVSKTNLKGKLKDQYCHIYGKPRLLLKKAVTFSPELKLIFEKPAYKAFLENIRNRFNLP